MADKTEFLQAIDDALLDADSLEKFINGDDTQDVLTRLSKRYPTLQKALKELFENNGIAGRYKTLAELQSKGVSLEDSSYALVADDTNDKNGIYIKEGGAWVKSKYDVTKRLNEVLNSVFTVEHTRNLFNKDTVVMNSLVNNEGIPSFIAGWSRSDFIPVTGGKYYTISGQNRRTGVSFFTQDNAKSYISGSFTKSGDANPATVLAPLDANYMLINVQQAGTPDAKNIQVEEGQQTTDYVPHKLYSLKNKLSVNDIDSLQNKLDGLSNMKPYEIEDRSKNLFDESKIQDGKMLNNDGQLRDVAGWGASDFIQVEAGKAYTVSGSRGRHGVAFYDSKETTETPLYYSMSTEMPLTLTAPNNAKYAVINVYSASNTSYNNLMFEQSSSATAYEPYYSYVGISSNYIVSNSTNTGSSIKLAGGQATIKTGIDLDVELGLSLINPVTKDKSSVFNFVSDTVNDELVRVPDDDVAPVRLDGFTVGANHGHYANSVNGAHDKTDKDIGSVWSDGSKQFILIDAIDGSLTFTAKDDNSAVTGNTMTHVSGAVNTSAVNSSSKRFKQWYPSINNHDITLFVDGQKIDASIDATVSYKDKVVVHESYGIMSKADMVAWVIANKGKSFTQVNAEPSVLLNYTYEFDTGGGCTIYASLTCLKSVPFEDWMLTQSRVMQDTSRQFYVPKTIGFILSGVNYDFSQPLNLASEVPTSIRFNQARNEQDANPVDRVLQLTKSYGYATGYLPLLDAEPSARKVNASRKYAEIRNNSLKTYPSLIDGVTTQLKAGDSFSGIGYRKYFKRDANRTAKYVVRSNVADFLYLDWHKATTDIIELDDDLIGREFTVHEKSSNVTLLSKFATNNIVVKVDSSKSYGYLVLRFNK